MNTLTNILFTILGNLTIIAAHPVDVRQSTSSSAHLVSRSFVVTDPKHLWIGFGVGGIFVPVLGLLIWLVIRNARK